MQDKHIRFITARAAALLVRAYAACIREYEARLPLNLTVGPDAPDTYRKLRDLADNHKTLRVSNLNNDTSVYGASGNITFRAFHDYGHLLHRAQFTTEAEIILAVAQWLDVYKHIPQEWREVCRVVYHADTVRTSIYERDHGEFPVDQKAFILPFVAAHFG